MGLTPEGGEKKPIEILPNVVVLKISSGADHLVMLADDGQLHTVGCGEQGQLGRVSERVADRSSRQGLSKSIFQVLSTIICPHQILSQRFNAPVTYTVSLSFYSIFCLIRSTLV